MVIGTASTFEPSFNIGSFENRMNVGIVGGGTGGVVAGMALERAGISVAVYERAPKLQEVGAGMMLWPNATRVLKDLRVLDHVAARSGTKRSKHKLSGAQRSRPGVDEHRARTLRRARALHPSR